MINAKLGIVVTSKERSWRSYMWGSGHIDVCHFTLYIFFKFIYLLQVFATTKNKKYLKAYINWIDFAIPQVILYWTIMLCTINTYNYLWIEDKYVYINKSIIRNWNSCYKNIIICSLDFPTFIPGLSLFLYWIKSDRKSVYNKLSWFKTGNLSICLLLLMYIS